LPIGNRPGPLEEVAEPAAGPGGADDRSAGVADAQPASNKANPTTAKRMARR
jgi:hypothetical protein